MIFQETYDFCLALECSLQAIGNLPAVSLETLSEQGVKGLESRT